MTKIFLILILFISIIIITCSEEPPVVPPPPPEPEPKATISLQDKSCTEFWLRLELENFTLPVNVRLIKDNLLQTEIDGLSSNDTTLYIDSLLPNKTYSFIAVVTGNEQQDTSSQLQAATLDTTSHSFSYQTWELGEPLTGNSSILYDVAIVDANNIYAVGEIYMLDSLGQTDTYGIVHWNGQSWEPIKLYYSIPNVGEFVLSNIRGILYLSSNEIWFAAGSIFRWDGVSPNAQLIFSRLNLSNPNGSIEKLWGNSNSYLYGVGNKGTIVIYNGQSWQQISSGTEFALIDIYSKDGNEIYAAGINVSEVKGVVLKGAGNQFSVMINSEIIDESELFDKLYGDLASVWVDELGTVYSGGNLLYRYKNNEWNYVTSLPENFIGGNPGLYYRGALWSIRGNASNDYIIAGQRNTLKHFNGVSWAQIGLPYSSSSPIIWYKVDQKGNTAVAVGDRGSYAFIILLNR